MAGTSITEPLAPGNGYTPGYGGGGGPTTSAATPDTTAPNVSLTAPLNGSTVSGSITLSATASDDVAVAGVNFYINGVLTGSEDTSSPYSISWDTTATSSGSKSIVAVARDAAGNRATSTAVVVTVDNTAPIISSISYTATGTTTATITWNTDETATSHIAYGLTSSYGSYTTLDSTFNTNHSQNITGLTRTTLYHFVVVSTDAAGNTATSSDQTFSTLDYDIYVDSVSGNDSNSGLSPATAFATLAKAQTTAAADGNGVKIGLARGSNWRQELNLSTLNHVTVAAYGSGNPPIVDASDALSGWQVVPGFSNTYVATATPAVLAGTNGVLGNFYYRVWENANEFLLSTSVSNVNSTAGRAYVDLTGTTPVIYVHPADGSNPATNGRTYEVNTRDLAIDIGSGSLNKEYNSIVGIDTKRGLNNNGSIQTGPNATISQTIAESGGKHNILVAAGEVDDLVVWDVSPNVSQTTSSMYVSFFDTSTTLSSSYPLTINRMFVIGNQNGQTNAFTSGMYNHTNGGTFSSVTVRGLAITDMHNPGSINASTAAATTFTGVYLRNTLPLNYGTGNYSADCVLINGASNSSNGINGNYVTLSNLASYGSIALWGLATSTIANSVIIDPSGQPSNQVSTNLTLSHSMLFGIRQGGWGTPYVLETDIRNYHGDYNIYAWTYYGHPSFLDQSSNVYSSLSAWQTATGQDAHSVYLTAAQYANFWLGDPSTGDFRINPNAQVTGGDGTVYTGTFPDGTLITTAGPQYYWNWSQSAKVSGAPTAWPSVPDTLSKARQYISNPTGWTF